MAEDTSKATEFLDKERTAKVLRTAKAEYFDRLDGANSASGPREGTIDKHDFGFNRDGRFSAFSVRVNLDSWIGHWGSSSCSTFLHVPDRGAAEVAFLEYLNLHVWEIMEGIADIIDRGNGAAKEAYVEELRAELDRLAPAPEAS